MGVFYITIFRRRLVRGDGGVGRVLNDAAAAATALYYIIIYAYAQQTVVL